SGTGSYSFEFGLSVDKSGVVSLDKDKLKDAIAQNPDKVKNFFFGPQGVTKQMTKKMDEIFGTSGTLTSELDGMSKELSDIQSKLDNIDKQNEVLKESIIDKYAGFEVRIGTLNQQYKMVSALIKGLN